MPLLKGAERYPWRRPQLHHQESRGYFGANGDSRLNPDEEVVDEEVELKDAVQHMAGLSSAMASQDLFSTLEGSSQSLQSCSDVQERGAPMMSVHSDYYVSVQILDTLMEITIKNASINDAQSKAWIPSLSDISAIFINMGVPFRSLFPLQHLQPTFSEDDILSEMQITVGKQTSGETSAGPAFSCLPETNLINVVKFLGFCTTMYPDGYADQELLLVLVLLFKISLEKRLQQIPLIDLQGLLLNLLKNIRDWDAQMSLLYQYLVQMKPSDLLQKKIEARKEQQDDLSGESVRTELEQQAYYLTYSLLHLVSEVSCFDVVNSNQRKCLLKLCGALEKHVKCDIREDARLFYRTKVKDLVARIYGKWQEMIQNSRPTQVLLNQFFLLLNAFY
ncbi:hypothetical protein UY3_13791 [Chelonia mydas]|uniref:Coiled-coil SMC6 And NSE5 INteracting (CANIN) domain-containing protein n=1 Tax=Chelonia mydas TaxID=8469 RepID=M7AUH9_CHEMY|nr:hypothetical protein UY3_13791 [Chelonia mydas]